MKQTKSRLAAAFSKTDKGSLFPTVCALIIMTVVQAAIIGANSYSVSEIFPRLTTAWINILKNNTYSGIIALGMCFVVISGGIDISVGSLMCAAGAFLMYLIDPVSGLLASIGIYGVWAYIIACVLTFVFGAMLGAFNGVLISNFNIPPFVATLGTMKIFRSLTQQLTQGCSFSVPDGFKKIASFKIGNQVILPILYWIAIGAILYFVLKKTVFGRYTVAIGSNERAAQYSGINTNAVKRMIYIVAGLMCAASAVIYVSRIGSMDFSSAGNGYEMDAIAATVVGGAAMSGGKGSVIGTFLGVIIIGIINNILNSVGVPTFLCDAVRGAIIIFAVLVQYKKEKD